MISDDHMHYENIADLRDRNHTNNNFQQELTELLDRYATNRQVLDSSPARTQNRRPTTGLGHSPSSEKRDLERVRKFNETFNGDKRQNIEAFFDRFDLWCETNGHDDAYKAKYFVFCLEEPAYSVYKSLDENVRKDYQALKRDLITFYAPTKLPIEEQYEQLLKL